VDLTAVDSTSITGWTISSGSVDYIGSYWTASDGARSVDLNGLNAGTIQQDITGLTSGSVYRIYFDLAGNPDNGPTTKTLDVMASLDTASYSFTVPGGASHSNMGWLTQTFIFTATASTATLSFMSTTGGDPGQLPAYGPALDNVRIVEVPNVAEVPLPGSLSLMLLGLGGLGAGYFGRKRRKAAA
jgi:choice-of-anchor C domain-containing protein